MKKLRFLAAIIAVCLIAGVMSGCSVNDNTVLADVNGEKITKAEFALYFLQIQNNMLTQNNISTAEQAEAYWKSDMDGKTAADVARETAMDQIVITELKCQKAGEFGISLTDEEKKTINEQIGLQITEMGGRSIFQAELKSIGTTEDAYVSFMESMYLASKVDAAMAEKSEYTVTEDEARESIKNTYIRAKHILLTNVDSKTGAVLNDEELKKRVDDVYNAIIAGEDFDEFMRIYSEDPGLESAPDGYEFGKGQMVEEFEEAAYALEVGEVSEPVETSFGYHIVKREEFNPTTEKIEELLPTEMQILGNIKLTNVYEQWKSAAEIDINERALAKVKVIQ